MFGRTSILLSLSLISCGAQEMRAGVATNRPAVEAVDEIGDETNDAPRVLLNTPVFYEVPEGDSTRTIHTPLIRARVGGIDTLLILDTGASDSIFMNTLGDAIDVLRTDIVMLRADQDSNVHWWHAP